MKIVERIRTDEEIHVQSLRLYLGELRSVTFKTADGEPRDGQVALDSAVAVQHLGIGQPAGRLADVVGRDPVERRRGIRPLDGELGERALVEQRDPLAAGPVLLADRFEPVRPREG